MTSQLVHEELFVGIGQFILGIGSVGRRSLTRAGGMLHGGGTQRLSDHYGDGSCGGRNE